MAITGDKMKIIAGEDWEAFATAITAMKTNVSTPTSFFDHFYWKNIALKAFEGITQLQ